MESLILEIKDQLYQTVVLCKDYLKNVNLATALLGLALFYVIFLRRWTFKKIISFFVTIFLLFILLVRIEAFLLTTFGAEGSNIGIGVGRTVFFILVAMVLIYHAAVKE